MTSEPTRPAFASYLFEAVFAVKGAAPDDWQTGRHEYQVIVTQHKQYYLPRVLILKRQSPSETTVVGTAPLTEVRTIEAAITAGLRWCEQHAEYYGGTEASA